MIGQIAFCVSLLVISGVTVNGFLRLMRTNPGFHPEQVLTAEVRQPILKPGEVVKHYPTRRFARVAGQMVAAVEALPGASSAAVAWYAPMSGVASTTRFHVLESAVGGPLEGAPAITGPDARRAIVNIVTPRYFETLGIPLIAGRAFVPEDRLSDSQIDDHAASRGVGAAIVNQAFARLYWPGEDATKKYLAVSHASYRSVLIVGIVGDVRLGPARPAEPTIYLPFGQAPRSSFRLLVRAGVEPQAA